MYMIYIPICMYTCTHVSRVPVHISRGFRFVAGERFSCEQHERGMKRDEIVIFSLRERKKNAI